MTRARPILAMLLLAAVPAAHADWRNDYQVGVRAAQAGQWEEVERRMRQAIAEEPLPNERKRFQGTVYNVYVPHYYAGLAAWRRGDCEQALRFWENVAHTAVIAKLADLAAEQQRGIGECRQRLAATRVAAQPATTAAPPAAAESRPPVPPPVGPRTTSQGTRPAATTAAPPVADTSRQVRPTAAQPAGVAPATRPPPAPVASPGAPAVAGTNGAAPAMLRKAVEAWLGGRYREVLTFDPQTLADSRARAHVLLLRAASRHTLALLEDDSQALAQAGSDAKAARALNAQLRPDEQLFSPRFREFYASAR